MTVVYIDSVFLLNLVLNYLLLAAAARLSGQRMYRLRMGIGACFGALYAVAVYLPGCSFLTSPALKLCIAVLVVLISFGGVRHFLRMVLIFFGVSFAFGGGVLALSILSEGKLDYNNLLGAAGMRELLLSFAICYLLFTFVFRRTAQHGGSQKDILSITLTFQNKTTDIQALMDTGNTLTDPLTNAPALVTEAEAIGSILPHELFSIFMENGLEDPAGALEKAAAAGYGKWLRLIPYKTVCVNCGLLLALRMDQVVIGGKKQKNMLAALSPNRLSDGGAYHALVGCQDDETKDASRAAFPGFFGKGRWYMAGRK